MSGECQVIIALHCTSGHLEAFSRNIVPHGRAGYRIHAIDALGHGYTDKPNAPYEVYKYGEHVLRYMGEQGIEQAHLMGESLGGWTSGWPALNHPAREVGSEQCRVSGCRKVWVSGGDGYLQ